MTTYFGVKNNNKFSDRSPDYFVFRTKEEEPGIKQKIGRIYRNKSKKGSDYLKIDLNPDGGDLADGKTYFGYRNGNRRSEKDPDWDLFPPNESENKKREKVGNVFEYTDEKGDACLEITFFNDSDGQKGKGMEPRKSNR